MSGAQFASEVSLFSVDAGTGCVSPLLTAFTPYPSFRRDRPQIGTVQAGSFTAYGRCYK